MGIVEHVVAACPTEGCKGRLYDQVKTGEYGSYEVPHDGYMDPVSAYNVNGCVMVCSACGAEYRVDAEPPTPVRVRLKELKKGDVNLTIPKLNLRVNKIPESEKGTLRHLRGEQSKPSRDEYLALQVKAGCSETEPVNFDYKEGGFDYMCRAYYTFEERVK